MQEGEGSALPLLLEHTGSPFVVSKGAACGITVCCFEGAAYGITVCCFEGGGIRDHRLFFRGGGIRDHRLFFRGGFRHAESPFVVSSMRD